jgi:adenine-specific DNA methylase
MATDFWKPCAKDSTPELADAVAVWLSTLDARFLNSRYITTNWDVEELVKRQEEVVQKALLKAKLAGGLRRQNMSGRLTDRSAI